MTILNDKIDEIKALLDSYEEELDGIDKDIDNTINGIDNTILKEYSRMNMNIVLIMAEREIERWYVILF